MNRRACLFALPLLVACSSADPRGDGGPPESDAATDGDVGPDGDAADGSDGDGPALDASDGGEELDGDDADPCMAVECGNGRCVASDGGASCECDEDFHAEGLACVPAGCEEPDCPRPVAEWQAMFDERWNDADEADCVARSLSGGGEQEHYFLAYCINGLTAMWRASGEDRYLDRVLELIANTMEDAVLGSDGYRHWPVEYALWESYYWRFVVTLLRVMQANPDLLDRGDYRAQYAELLDFSEVHIWDKWMDDGLGNLYRSRTHMASHWARIAMELSLITGNEAYLPVFDNISRGEMVGYPSNIREQLLPNPTHPEAYLWSSEWDVDPTVSVQDTSHGGAVVSFIANAFDHGLYWSADDVAALSSTLTDVVWPSDLGGSYHRNVDGTDGDAGEPYGPPWGRLHEWLVLGQYDLAIQRRIETDYSERNYEYFGIHGLGIAALNAKILTDGAPAY